jgi:hypothetical protein
MAATTYRRCSRRTDAAVCSTAFVKIMRYALDEFCTSVKLAETDVARVFVINAGQGSFDFRRQGLADDVSVETAEVFADRAQQLIVRYRETPSITPDAASHSRLQITALVEIETG